MTRAISCKCKVLILYYLWYIFQQFFYKDTLNHMQNSPFLSIKYFTGSWEAYTILTRNYDMSKETADKNKKSTAGTVVNFWGAIVDPDCRAPWGCCGLPFTIPILWHQTWEAGLLHVWLSQWNKVKTEHASGFRSLKLFQDCQYRHVRLLSEDTPRLIHAEGLCVVNMSKGKPLHDQAAICDAGSQVFL